MAEFVFNEANLERAKLIISHYPHGRQRSAIIALLDLAQRQNDGWLSKDCIEYVADMLDTPYIRAYEVATFYTMFNLAQIGKYHIQVCGTTPCWLRGASDIMKACEKELGVKCKGTTTDGTFTLSEVECLGACVNGPMIQINDDYYEDLSPEIVLEIISKLRNGEKIIAGPQINRLNSAPSSEGVKC